MKSLAVFGILAAVVLIVSANNVTWGVVGPYDRIVATDYVIKKSSWFSTQKVDLDYPPKGHVNYATLTAIRAWDWGGPKQFGYVSLIKGGPGHRNSTLHFKSQSGKGLNFTIQYFAR